MRTEREMTALILGVAEQDSRVRAVFMNGSRANPNAPRDIFQDYDIVYVVEETASFRAQPGWVDVFGERLVMQTPDEMDHAAGQPTDLARCYGYLMQFADGNRIDLRLMTLSRALEECQSDSQTIVLLDKDGILPPLPLPSDTAYHIRRPDQTAFAGCCNEFRWTLPYVAKGLWRGRVTYALDTLNACVRPQLLHMLSWLAGTRTGFAVSAGKSGADLPAYLPAGCWERYLSTYADAEPGHVWAAVFAAATLFLDARIRLPRRWLSRSTKRRPKEACVICTGCVSCPRMLQKFFEQLFPPTASVFIPFRKGAALKMNRSSKTVQWTKGSLM